MDPVVEPFQRDDGQLRRHIMQALEQLSPRQRNVVMWRFGLSSAGEQSLSDIGELLGLTHQRVRQIEAQAIRKLRQPNIAAPLEEFWRAESD